MASATKTAGSGQGAGKKKTACATDDDHPEYVNPSEFARMFNMDRGAVIRACDAGSIDAIPLPTAGKNIREHRRIPWSEVERIKAGKPKPEPEAQTEAPAA